MPCDGTYESKSNEINLPHVAQMIWDGGTHSVEVHCQTAGSQNKG